MVLMYYSFSSPWCKPHPVPRITHSTRKESWLIGFKSQASLGKSPSPAHGVPPAPGRRPAFSSFSIGRKCSVSKICRYGILAYPLCSEQVEPFPARDARCRFEFCQELLPRHSSSKHEVYITVRKRGHQEMGQSNLACLARLVQQPDKIWSYPEWNLIITMVLCLLFPLSTQNAQAPLSPDEYLLQQPAKGLVCISLGHPLVLRLKDQGEKEDRWDETEGSEDWESSSKRCEQCDTAHFLRMQHI